MSDRQDELPECHYSYTTIDKCDCPKCEADGCKDCIAHTRPWIDGKRYCVDHFMWGTGTSTPQGIFEHD